MDLETAMYWGDAYVSGLGCVFISVGVHGSTCSSLRNTRRAPLPRSSHELPTYSNLHVFSKSFFRLELTGHGHGLPGVFGYRASLTDRTIPNTL